MPTEKLFEILKSNEDGVDRIIRNAQEELRNLYQNLQRQLEEARLCHPLSIYRVGAHSNLEFNRFWLDGTYTSRTTGGETIQAKSE